jgi:chemotaxis protein MotB
MNSSGGRRKHKEEEHENSERWLVSYADFITLLFAFFTTMYAISNVDNKKLNSMVESMREAFGGGRDTATPRPMPSDSEARDNTLFQIIRKEEDWRIRNKVELNLLKRKLDLKAQAMGLKGSVRTLVDERGLVIRISESGGFEVGKADILPDKYPLFNAIGMQLREMDNDIQIQGHTDNVPIHNSYYKSNWELSTARATTVLKFFIERHQIVPKRMSAAGYGEYYPVADNKSDEGRGRNRRVDVIILLTRRGVKPDAQYDTGAKEANYENPP